jgi:hypothetical protein
MIGVEGDAPKLGSHGILSTFKPDFLLVIMQLIVPCENICSRAASTGVDCPNKLPNLHSRIWCSLVQLDPKFLQNFCKHWVGRHTKPCYEEGFKKPPHHLPEAPAPSLNETLDGNPSQNNARQSPTM